MDNKYISLVIFVLFGGTIIVTFIEALLDIRRGGYKGYKVGQKPTYLDSIFPCIPWCIAAIVGGFFIKYFSGIESKFIFLAIITLAAYVASSMIYKYFNAIPLFFCVVFLIIGIGSIYSHARFVSLEENILKINSLANIPERKEKTEVIREEIKEIRNAFYTGLKALGGFIGVCMVILMTVKQYKPLVKGGYPILLVVGSLYVLFMLLWFLFSPLMKLSSMVMQLLM